jgi:dTDP-4-dehydrorhamnose reductase
MRCLIFGGQGMLGHRLWQVLSQRHEVAVTVRGTWTVPSVPDRCPYIYEHVDVRDPDRVEAVLADFHPDVVVNAAGIVKQRLEECNPATCFQVNTVFPHQLANLAVKHSFRLVHISTDCVFSGARGNYCESDLPDATDLYGVSKRWGELHEPPAVTLRTSMIGLEIKHHTGLIEWFLAQRGPVPGYRQAIFSGLTTAELARVIDRLLGDWAHLTGLWHVGAAAISKYELLKKLTLLLARADVEVVPDDSIRVNRSLNSERFAGATGYRAPSWDAMLVELAREIAARQRRQHYHEAA